MTQLPGIVIRTRDGPQKTCISQCLHTISGSDYYSMFPRNNLIILCCAHRVLYLPVATIAVRSDTKEPPPTRSLRYQGVCGELDWVRFRVVISYIKPIPTHEKIFAVGNSGPHATFNLFFLGLGWPWVGELVGFIIIVTLFPTQQNLVIANTLL